MWRHCYSRSGFLMPPHFLANFEIRKHYERERKINGVYARNNLPAIKDGAYVINYDEYKSIGTNWVDLYVNCNNVIYLTALELNIFQKKEQNYHHKY